MCDSSSSMKRCAACGAEKPATIVYFYGSQTVRSGLTCDCRDCVNAAQRKRHLKKRKAFPRLNEEGLLRCGKCKAYKPLDDFAILTKGLYGRRGYCRACEAASFKARYVPGERTTLPAQGLRRCTICKQVFPATTEHFRKQGGKKAHSSGLASNCKPCHSARVRDRQRVFAHRRRELLRQTPPGEAFTVADVEQQLKDQKGKCYWCQKALKGVYHIDHLFAVAKGGDNRPGNIVCACPFCNLSKSDRTPWEFAGRLM